MFVPPQGHAAQGTQQDGGRSKVAWPEDRAVNRGCTCSQPLVGTGSGSSLYEVALTSRREGLSIFGEPRRGHSDSGAGAADCDDFNRRELAGSECGRAVKVARTAPPAHDSAPNAPPACTGKSNQPGAE